MAILQRIAAPTRSIMLPAPLKWNSARSRGPAAQPSSSIVFAARNRLRRLVANASSEGERGSPEAAVSQELAALRQAATLIADRYVEDGRVLGLGTGLTVNYLVEELAKRISRRELLSIRIVPGSDVTASEAAFHGLPLTTLEAAGPLYLTVEVAEELALGPSEEGSSSPGSVAFVVGRQQAPPRQQLQLPRARALAAAAARCVVIAEGEDKVVERLGGALPVWIDADDWEDTAEELDDVFVGDAEVWRRSSEPNAGPRGGDSPYISPEGENILDIRFDEGLKLFGEDAEYSAIAQHIEEVPGVVAHGLVVHLAAAAVIAGPDGPAVVETSAFNGDSQP